MKNINSCVFISHAAQVPVSDLWRSAGCRAAERKVSAFTFSQRGLLLFVDLGLTRPDPDPGQHSPARMHESTLIMTAGDKTLISLNEDKL